MSGSDLRRRDVLVAVSGGCTTLAGCTEHDSSDAPAEAATTGRSGYGTAYGDGYGTE